MLNTHELMIHTGHLGNVFLAFLVVLFTVGAVLVVYEVALYIGLLVIKFKYYLDKHKEE